MILAEMDITALLAIVLSGAVKGTMLPYNPFVIAILSGILCFMEVGTFSITSHCC